MENPKGKNSYHERDIIKQHIPKDFEIAKDVELVPFDPRSINVIKAMMSDMFPVRYDDCFYKRLTSDPIYQHLTRIAKVNGMPIGIVVAFLEPETALDREFLGAGPEDTVEPGQHEGDIIMGGSRVAWEAPQINNPYAKNAASTDQFFKRGNSSKSKQKRMPRVNATAYVASIAVVPAFRGMGIAKFLLYWLEVQLHLANNIVDFTPDGRVNFPGSLEAQDNMISSAYKIRRNMILKNMSGTVKAIHLHVDCTKDNIMKLYMSVGYEKGNHLAEYYTRTKKDPLHGPRDAYRCSKVLAEPKVDMITSAQHWLKQYKGKQGPVQGEVWV